MPKRYDDMNAQELRQYAAGRRKAAATVAQRGDHSRASGFLDAAKKAERRAQDLHPMPNGKAPPETKGNALVPVRPTPDPDPVSIIMVGPLDNYPTARGYKTGVMEEGDASGVDVSEVYLTCNPSNKWYLEIHTTNPFEVVMMLRDVEAL